MKHTEHTPGPWTIQHGTSSRVYLINDRHGHAVGELVYSDTRNPSDAQLIAAAPDLLRALSDLLNVTPRNYDNRHEHAAAQDAIYKALGA